MPGGAPGVGTAGLGLQTEGLRASALQAWEWRLPTGILTDCTLVGLCNGSLSSGVCGSFGCLQVVLFFFKRLAVAGFLIAASEGSNEFLTGSIRNDFLR